MVELVDVFKPLKIGVGTVVYKEGRAGETLVLLGKRATNHKDKWAIPGGTVDDYVGNPELPEEKRDKSVKQAAAREILEETGLEIDQDSLKIVSIDDNDIENTNYINFGCAVRVHLDIEPKLSEASHKHEFQEWRWFRLVSNNYKLSFQDIEGQTAIEEPEIFYPCVPSLKGFYKKIAS